MFCSKCGSENSASAKFCRQCGNDLGQPDDETSTQERQTQAYMAVIGSKNQQYYLDQFFRFDDKGKVGMSWHWPAFFVTLNWLLYRKMWLNALIYFFGPFVAAFPIGLFVGLVSGLGLLGEIGEQASTLIAAVIYAAAVLGFYFLPPLYANALYYKHCKKLIAQARAASPDHQRQLGELSGKGGTSGIVMILVLVLGVIFMVGVLAAIALPAYQDYTTRAKMASVVITANQAADAVTRHYEQHEEMPASLQAAGFAAPASSFVKKVEFDDKNAVVTVTLAAAPLKDKTLQMVLSVNDEKRFVWTCQSEDIANKYLPQQCRK